MKSYLCLGFIMSALIISTPTLRAQTSTSSILEISLSGGLCYPDVISDLAKYWNTGYNVGLGIGAAPRTSEETKKYVRLSLIARYGRSQPNENRLLSDLGITRDNATTILSEPLSVFQLSGTVKFYLDLKIFIQPYFSIGIGYYHISGSQIIVEKNTPFYYLYSRIWSEPADVFLIPFGCGLNFPIKNNWSIFVEADFSGGLKLEPFRLLGSGWINVGTRVSFPSIVIVE